MVKHGEDCIIPTLKIQYRNDKTRPDNSPFSNSRSPAGSIYSIQFSFSKDTTTQRQHRD